jgi:hypothetical protein
MDVEWLILADSAQVMGNKLYVLGGGWDRLTLNRPLPVNHQMAVAAAFQVDWNETNERHQFEIEIVAGDGATLGNVKGAFEVGRPPGIPPGHRQRTQIAVNLTLPLKEYGTYEIVAKLDGEIRRRSPFLVMPGPGQNQVPPK